MLRTRNSVNMFGRDACVAMAKRSVANAARRFRSPNRDGTLGRGGCAFCNVASICRSGEAASLCRRTRSLIGAASTGRSAIWPSFQAYTAPSLKCRCSVRCLVRPSGAQYRRPVAQPPDCVPQAVLDLLRGYRRQGYEVSLELGCDLMTRPCIALTVDTISPVIARTAPERERGLRVCAHPIVGLPRKPGACSADAGAGRGDRRDPNQTDPLQPCERQHYGRSVAGQAYDGIEWSVYRSPLEVSPPYAARGHARRLPATRRPTLLAPLWCENRWTGMVELDRYLNRQGAGARRWAVAGLLPRLGGV